VEYADVFANQVIGGDVPMYRGPGRINEANHASQINHNNPASNLFRDNSYLLQYLLDLLIGGNYIIHWTYPEKTNAGSPLIPPEDFTD